MPTFRRSARSWAGEGALPSEPLSTASSTTIWPDWMASSPLMERSSVLLPEPLRPMMATTWPLSTLRSTPLSTWLLP